jgi:hypothetical protein
MTVPYTFATATGNIPLSELDVNFANVKAYVYTAGTVVTNAQPNITSVGTLSSLTISELTTTNDVDVTGQLTINWLDGNAAPLAGPGILASTANIYDIGESSKPFRSGYFNGNIYVGNIINTGSSSFSGNISANNLSAGAAISATGNIRGGNITTAGLITATGTVYTGNIISAGLSSTAGNVIGGNIITAGLITATGNVSGNFLLASNIAGNLSIRNNGLEFVTPYFINLTSNAQPANLSTTASTNFINANNTGYTCTVNFPPAPLPGQITRFTVTGNTVTLTAGTGNVSTTFAGSATVGTGFKYIYNSAANVWYKSI